MLRMNVAQNGLKLQEIDQNCKTLIKIAKKFIKTIKNLYKLQKKALLKDDSSI